MAQYVSNILSIVNSLNLLLQCLIYSLSLHLKLPEFLKGSELLCLIANNVALS